MNRLKLNSNNAWLLIAGVIAIVLFASWIPLQLYLGLQQYPGIAAGSNLLIKSTYNWMPIIKAITQGNLFPASPAINLAQHGLHFYPYISLWIFGLINYVGGYTANILIGQFLFPCFSFMLMVLILKRYLSPLWSISLTMLGLISFVELPFRNFLLSFLTGNGLFALSAVQPLEIIQYPIPAFSVFIFLLLFYISTKEGYLSTKKTTILTALWALLIYVHPMDAVFGLIFWFSYFSIRIYRQKVETLKLIKLFSLQLFLVLIIAAPAIYGYINQIFTNNIYGTNAGSWEISWFYYIIYFIVPVFLMLVIYITQQVDFFEILYKFWHIYMLLLIEFLLTFAISHSLLQMGSYTLKNRIAFFFLHFYYYVPVIYFASRPFVTYHFGLKSNIVLTYIRRGIHFAFCRLSLVYLPIFIVMLGLFSSVEAYKNYLFQRDVAFPALKSAWSEIDLLKTVYNGSDTVVSETPLTNLLIELDNTTSYSTLWINRFSNNISVQESVERFALYARIYQWSLNDFINFMSPGAMQNNSVFPVNLNTSIYTSGIGYELLLGDHLLTDLDKKTYLELLKTSYNNLNVQQKLKSLNVKKIYSTHLLELKDSNYSRLKFGQGYIYSIK